MAFIFYFLILKTSKQLKAFDTLKISCFVLPAHKKIAIFLRAPYKNKLARLNILRPEYTIIMSIKITTNCFQKLNLLIPNVQDFCNLVSSNNHLNLSTHKIKHVKSTISLTTSNPHNFVFNNFN